MAQQKFTGNQGEEIAQSYLVAKGYKIKAKNFRYRKGEIDLIAEKDKTLVFIEVKARNGNGYGDPEDFVSKKQAALILDAAEDYIFKKNWLGDIRFDIISIELQPAIQIEHFEDAFY